MKRKATKSVDIRIGKPIPLEKIATKEQVRVPRELKKVAK